MDIYDYLKKDHEKVSGFFKEFENATDMNYRLEIFQMINRELLIHAASEQETFYKALEKFQDTIDIDIVEHGEKEHRGIEVKLDQLSNFTVPNAAWVKQVLELKKLVDHHVSEEEGKIFHQAKKVLSDEQAIEIKEQMHDLKDKILQELGE